MPTPNADLLIDLRERMVRIETKLDVQAEKNETVQATQDDHDERLKAQDVRITSLETMQKVYAAVGAIILFLVTFFQSSIAKLIGA